MDEHVQKPVEQSEDGKSPETSKALLFLVLSVLWIFPSFGACWIIASDFSRWRIAENVTFSSVKLEEWLAVVLLLLHGIFVFLALRFRRRERRHLTSGGSSGI